jgi:hypothetical protein
MSSKLAKTTGPLAGGGGGGGATVLKALVAETAALPVPVASVTLFAGTVIVTVPVAAALGVTTSVALVPDKRANAPFVPPVTTTSSVVNDVPTSRLNENVKVIGPVATSALTLFVIVTTGGADGTTLSGRGGGGSPLPPPHAANESANRAADNAARM